MSYKRDSKFVYISLTLLFLCRLSFWAKAPAQDITDENLAAFVLEPYRVVGKITHDFEGKGHYHHFVAIANKEEDFADIPVKLLHFAWDGDWRLIETIVPRNKEGEWMQNFFTALSVERIGETELLYLETFMSGGGSGSLHLFEFYTLEDSKLKLVKAYEHDRMERLYFCIYNNAIYDSVVVKKRGEKKEKVNAYVYYCWMEVTKFTCDGRAIVPVATEKCREKKGNKFLDEKYWCMSVLTALKRGEVFRTRHS